MGRRGDDFVPKKGKRAFLLALRTARFTLDAGCRGEVQEGVREKWTAAACCLE
jgi:hypothetical protein